MQHREVIIDYLVEKYLNRVINDSLMMPTSNRHILPRTIISKKTIKRIQNRVDYEKSFKEGMEDTKDKGLELVAKIRKEQVPGKDETAMDILYGDYDDKCTDKQGTFYLLCYLSCFVYSICLEINQVDVTERGLGYQSDNLHYVVSFGNVLHGTDIFLMNYPSKTYHIITIINLIR